MQPIAWTVWRRAFSPFSPSIQLRRSDDYGLLGVLEINGNPALPTNPNNRLN
ncbi:MAG TPA: hypothetical protein VHB72_04710 [Candidatus Saccharimonadales bacterium]|nr:hypothetical protein [Candidatus Saccharimonadales bacterium]